MSPAEDRPGSPGVGQDLAPEIPRDESGSRPDLRPGPSTRSTVIKPAAVGRGVERDDRVLTVSRASRRWLPVVASKRRTPRPSGRTTARTGPADAMPDPTRGPPGKKCDTESSSSRARRVEANWMRGDRLVLFNVPELKVQAVGRDRRQPFAIGAERDPPGPADARLPGLDVAQGQELDRLIAQLARGSVRRRVPNAACATRARPRPRRSGTARRRTSAAWLSKLLRMAAWVCRFAISACNLRPPRLHFGRQARYHAPARRRT